MAAHPGLPVCAALLCLVTLVCAHLGAALDDRARGHEWLELLLITCAGASVLCVLAGGIAFGMFLRKADEKPDPSEGRGLGGS